MNESYAEAGVKRKKTAKTTGMKVGIIAGLSLVLILGITLLQTLLVLLAIIGFVISYSYFPRFNVEYEYIFCDGQLDFDKIMGNVKRKTALRIDFDKVDIMAPAKSHALDSYNNMQLKVKDFTSLVPEAKAYAIIYNNEKEKYKILFEPNEKMIACIKQKTPRKLVEY